MIAATHTLPEIREFLEADTVAYLSLDGLLRAVDSERKSYCSSCYTGVYPDTVSKLVAIEGMGPSPAMLKERGARKVGLVVSRRSRMR